MTALATLTAEVAHWKANHAHMVKRCAFLQRRPDLAVDRIPAFEALTTEVARWKAKHTQQAAMDKAMFELSDAMRAKLLAENFALKAAPSKLFTPQCDTAAGRQFEREAFAKGLHLAAHPQFTKA